MKTIVSAVFMTALLGLSLSLRAYDVVTHEEMSERAMKASYLAKDPELLKSLGLKPLAEEQKFPNSKNTGQTIPNLFRDGARFEDNFPRSLNHFYDPLSRTGLLFGAYIGNPSPDWALEDTATNHRQAYSLRDARDSLYKALTESKQNDRDANFGLTFQTLGQVIHHLQDMAQPQHVRNDMHLDQLELGGLNPLYNPSLYEKHTQGLGGNLPFTDAHYNQSKPVVFTTARAFWTGGISGNGRGIADFTNANFLSARTNFRGTTAPQPNANYPAPRWNGTTESVTFWDLLKEEGIACAPPPDGSGDDGPALAVSATPASTVSVAAVTAALDPALPPACQLNGPMVFYGTDVLDAYAGQSDINKRASTLSIFDQDLEKNTLPRAFSLNRFNFKAAYPHLIPKAVGYSAGLIDYFFRGRLEAQDVGYTDSGITLRVRNAIDAKQTPTWKDETLARGGKLVLAYEYQDTAGEKRHGTSNTIDLTENIAPAATSQNTYAFTFTIPTDAKKIKYRLVFHGKLGQENDAVAVGAVEPISGFLVTPSYLPIDGIPGPRLIEKRGGEWVLSDKRGLVAGNIDWKGGYVNGRATKVVSWNGPRVRYFADHISENRWQVEVYQDGIVFARAPNIVLGAAIAEDTAGNQWLVVVCQEGSSDAVYRRPNKPSTSQALYQPGMNEDGWREIGRVNAAQLINDPGADPAGERTPWFFSGNGREAQTLRGWDDRANATQYFTPHRESRLKIDIDADVSTITPRNLHNLGGYVSQRTCTGTANAGKTLTTNTQGEYIIAVDYRVKAGSNDTEEVLAKVRVEGSETRSSQVMFSPILRQFVPIANHVRRNWTEYFVWPEGEIVHYTQTFTRDSASTLETSSSRLYWRQLLYALDLRAGLYAYSFWDDEYNSTISPGAGGLVIQRTGAFKEGGEIVAGARPKIQIFGPTANTYTSTTPTTPDRLTQGAITCANGTVTDTSYGALDFSFSWRGDPLFLAVDSNQNIAASFDYRNFNNDRKHFNFLSGGSLEQVIPGGLPESRYEPLGVIR